MASLIHSGSDGNRDLWAMGATEAEDDVRGGSQESQHRAPPNCCDAVVREQGS